ncbi:hypothetical protein GCM10009733_021480 [Nonomuraea maheshkhaliensis]|uniref:Transposase IS204/IS1001/IS1096/IS1165 zinc-finger domain-containing protein n=1 Tax=Nonomuraea maheshkhaliensis TaxID=419590 RepID=A0ABN2F034_9ACTN
MRVHSRYERCLADLPVAGREVLLQVRMRRFFCDNTACAKRTFAEQVPGLISRHGRRAGMPAGDAADRGAGSGRSSRYPSYRALGLCGGSLYAVAAAAELA